MKKKDQKIVSAYSKKGTKRNQETFVFSRKEKILYFVSSGVGLIIALLVIYFLQKGGK
jgi:cell division protein FtsL